jgi:curved DNA-binding protein
MQNPYQTLGVDHNATADEIKRAYRKLASQHHPDKGGDKARFQEVQAAYDALTNPQRQQGSQSPFQGGFNPSGSFDFDSIFNMFGAQFTSPHVQRRQQARMSLWVTLRDVAQGGRKMVSVGTPQGTQAVDIEIPRAINDGDTVQYPGIGPGGMDLLVTFRIHPDPKFQRQDLNLYSDHTVGIWDLILGTDTQIRDILGNTLILNVPARTQPGTVLRLRGRGLTSREGAQGDLLIRIQASIPTDIPADLLSMIERNRVQ